MEDYYDSFHDILRLLPSTNFGGLIKMTKVQEYLEIKSDISNISRFGTVNEMTKKPETSQDFI